MAGEKSDKIKNFKGKTHKFPKAPQGLDEKKSQGQINLAKSNNILKSARTLFEAADILPDLVDNIKDEVQNGINKNALELLKIIKEPEEQSLKLEGQVQKIFITPEQQKNAMEHINKMIND